MNKVVLRGTLNKIEFSHESHGVKLYKTTIDVVRNSGVSDRIPIIISKKNLTELINNKLLLKIADEDSYSCPCIMTVTGEYRSINKLEENKHRLELYVFARSIEQWQEELETSINQVELECYVCKISGCRQTPFNKTICDLIVAVNNEKLKKSSYIPCIVWGRDAEIASSKLSIGDKINIVGRIQSREYTKNDETRIAYEVSISNII